MCIVVIKEFSSRNVDGFRFDECFVIQNTMLHDAFLSITSPPPPDTTYSYQTSIVQAPRSGTSHFFHITGTVVSTRALPAALLTLLAFSDRSNTVDRFRRQQCSRHSPLRRREVLRVVSMWRRDAAQHRSLATLNCAVEQIPQTKSPEQPRTEQKQKSSRSATRYRASGALIDTVFLVLFLLSYQIERVLWRKNQRAMCQQRQRKRELERHAFVIETTLN